MKKTIALLIAVLMANIAMGDIVYEDDFENKAFVASGNPDGWIIFGAPLLDRGTLHNAENHSPTASVWVAVSWSSWGWGATTQSNATRYDVADNRATVSTWMRATNAFSAQSVALTIYDEDGTQWRTADADRFQLTTSWTEYKTPLSNMVVETAGSVAGLNYTNITKFGFLAYTAGQTGGNQVQYDDFNVNAIPEPSVVAMLGLGVFVILVRRINRQDTHKSG